MIAYKATYNMKCINITFEVDKTYTFNGKLKMCEQGFHFCKNPMDITRWYDYNKDFILMEIEVLGDVIEGETKCVTNKFKVLRIVSPELSGITLNAQGKITKEVNPNGDIYTWEYNEQGNKTRHVNPNGYIYTWEYDSNNNLIACKTNNNEWSITIE